jgi:predicted ATPase
VAIATLAFADHRSLRDLRIAVGQLTVITGGLLADAADGQLGRSLAREGGMPSAMWAGPPSTRISVAGYMQNLPVRRRVDEARTTRRFEKTTVTSSSISEQSCGRRWRQVAPEIV